MTLRHLAASATLLAALALAHPASALETLEDTAAVRTLADAAMQHVGKGQLREATELLKPYWLLPDANAIPNFVEEASAKLQATAPVYGKPTGWEFLRERRVGDTMLRLGYLQRFENYAVSWELSLLRSPDGWLLRQVDFDDTLDPLFVAIDCARVAPKAGTQDGLGKTEGFQRLEQARDALDAVMAAHGRHDTAGATRALDAFPGNMERFQELFTRWPTTRSPIVHAEDMALGIERMLDARVGQSVARYTYLHRFRQDAVHWTAMLYRRPQGWALVNLSFSTDMDELFAAPTCP